MSDDVELRIRELRDQLAQEVRDRADLGVCGCGCGGRISAGGNGRRRYLDGHRQRAHRKRLELEARVRGIPARLSLKSLDGTESTAERHPDAQRGPQAPKRAKRGPRPGVTVYFPTVEEAELVARFLDARARSLEAIAATGAAGPQGPAFVRRLLGHVERGLERRRRRAA